MGKVSRRASRQNRTRTRTVTLDAETSAAFQEQFRAFEAKFGRPPGPDDPVFFDPDADTPQPISEERITNDTVRVMREVGLPEDLIYAFRQTGILPTGSNLHLFSKRDLRAWMDARRAYQRSHGMK